MDLNYAEFVFLEDRGPPDAVYSHERDITSLNSAINDVVNVLSLIDPALLFVPYADELSRQPICIPDVSFALVYADICTIASLRRVNVPEANVDTV